MPLSDEVSRNVSHFSSSHKHDEVRELLTVELKNGRISPLELLGYCRDWRFAPPLSRYVISADNIYQISIVMSEMGTIYSEHAPHFRQLSNERGSVMYSANCCNSLLRAYCQGGSKEERLLRQALDEADRGIAASGLERPLHKYSPEISYLFFVKGWCLEKLDEDREAWRAYHLSFCSNLEEQAHEKKITRPRHYNDLIVARRDLLKKTVRKRMSGDVRSLSSADGGDAITHGHPGHALAQYPSAGSVFGASDSSAASAPAHDVLVASGIYSHRPDSDRTVALPKEAPDRRGPGIKWERGGAAWYDAFDKTEFEETMSKRHKEYEKQIAAIDAQIELVDEMFVEESSANREERKKKLRQQKNELYNKWSSDINKAWLDPDYSKIFRRHAAETTFFNPRRNRKNDTLIGLVGQIIDQRFRPPDQKVDSINVSGFSARMLITAERLFQEAVLDLSVGLPGNYEPDNPSYFSHTKLSISGMPVAKFEFWKNRKGYNHFGPQELYQIGPTAMSMSHRANPKRERLGNCFVDGVGAYTRDISMQITTITSNEMPKERDLAELMIRYAKDGQAMTLYDLRRLNPALMQRDVDAFNRVCFLVMIKEQTQWHSAVHRNYCLGMSVAYARCLILIREGFITFQDAFKNSAIFSIYSHKDLLDSPSNIEASAKYIDRLYLVYLQQKHKTDTMSFFRRHVEKEKMPECVLTRKQAREDLQQVYGGESDSDGEGYESDLDFS